MQSPAQIMIGSILVAGVLAGPLAAQDDTSDAPLDLDPVVRMDPVVVTARKWEELAQEVAAGLTVIDEATLRDGGITTIREASFLVPNLQMTEFSARRLSFPTFRGISTGVGDPAVATYVDGVPQLNVSSTNLSLLDVDRLEFLRGPQGTLYGRSALGGIIKLETRRPTNTPELRATTTWGDYSLQEHTVSYSGPLVADRLYLGLSGSYSERDGYTRNTVTGNRVDDRRSTFGRGTLLYTPDDRNEFRFTTYAERSRDGGFALGDLSSLRMNSHRIAVDFEGLADRDILSNALTWRHDGDAVELTSISAYVDWDITEEADFDFTPVDGVRRFTNESENYLYQELRLASAEDRPLALGTRSSLRWLVGASFFSSNGDASAANEFRPGGAGIFFPPMNVGTNTERGDFDELGLAVFGQATLTIDDRIDLSAGLRYDYEDRDADITRSFATGGFTVFSSSTSQDESFDEFVPDFSLAFRPNDDVTYYGRAAKGFKAGGFNLSAPAGEETFDTETAWSYEGGIKTSWWDDRVTFNASAFYIDWDDLQLSLFDVNSGGYTDNAGGATSSGFELELAAEVCAMMDVFAGFGYTNAEFDEFTDQFNQDNAGNQLAFAPETTFNVGMQLNGNLGRDLRWYARGEYVMLGTYYLDAGNRESDRFELANFRLGVAWKNARLEGWIRNAFDDEYVQIAFQPSPVDPTRFVAESGAPQTFGLTLSLEF